MTQTHLSIVLHAHLPFVRHPENEFHLEEMWFFEAMHETYLPLLQMFHRLDARKIPGKLTLSVSAPLLTMMQDELLLSRFESHLERLIELARQEQVRTRVEAHAYINLADYYYERFNDLREFYVCTLHRDIIAALKQLHESGRIELITCVGTHPILPFLTTHGSRRTQVQAACDLFKNLFNFRPRGMWLAECAFTKGCDRYLADENIAFSFVEGTAIENAESAPVYGTFAPIISEFDVAFFGRDSQASAQVWSASEGYPGDFVYREFYRDLGFDLPFDYIHPFIHPDGIRLNTGLKYHRITGNVDLGDKQQYEPDIARARTRDHARHFISQRIAQHEYLCDQMPDRSAHICCPYDAELFGHWWFEGPAFLEALFEEIVPFDDQLILSTPYDYLAVEKVHQKTTPATSTWGENGDFTVWLDTSNAWIYSILHEAERKMETIARKAITTHDDVIYKRAITQAARELLLAQSSDWPFIMKTATAVEYATKRFTDHIANFEELYRQIENGEVNEDYVAILEERHNIFPQLDWSSWQENT